MRVVRDDRHPGNVLALLINLYTGEPAKVIIYYLPSGRVLCGVGHAFYPANDADAPAGDGGIGQHGMSIGTDQGEYPVELVGGHAVDVYHHMVGVAHDVLQRPSAAQLYGYNKGRLRCLEPLLLVLEHFLEFGVLLADGGIEGGKVLAIEPGDVGMGGAGDFGYNLFPRGGDGAGVVQRDEARRAGGCLNFLIHSFSCFFIIANKSDW